MKITFDVNSVLEQVAQVTSIANPNSPTTILQDVLITSYEDNGGVSVAFAAADEQTYAAIKTSLMNDSDNGFRIAINAKSFLTTLRNLGGHVVTLETDESTHIVNGKYNNGHFSMPYDDADVFPIPKVAKGDGDITITIDSQRLLSSIMDTENAVSTDELRPILTGVHFEFKNDCLVAVGTDGLRLARHTDNTIHCDNDNEERNTFTVPSKSARLLMTMLTKAEGDTTMVYNGKDLTLKRGEFKVCIRTLEGRYPNYNSVIPTEINNTITINKNELANAINRVLTMGDENSGLVRLSFNGNNVVVSAEDMDYNKSAKEKVSCVSDCEKFEIGFKGACVLSTLKKITTDEITMQLIECDRPAIIYPKTDDTDIEFLSLIMPMRLN